MWVQDTTPGIDHAAETATDPLGLLMIRSNLSVRVLLMRLHATDLLK